MGRNVLYNFSLGLKCIAFDKAMHNPLNPSYIPADLMNFGQHMTFPERVINTIAW